MIIGESVWSCEFYLDIVSHLKNPLEILTFDNLSMINSKFDTKLIKTEIDRNFEGHSSCRYYVVASFDFQAIAEDYPFDWQHIYISMSVPDQAKNGLLQPIPEELVDKEFQLDGWRIIDAKTGVLRKKRFTITILG